MKEITVLFVEDELNLLNSLSFILEEHGFDVLRASTGKEAVELGLAHRPQLVLLDIGLPDIDGFEVADQLQGLRREHGCRIVMLTGRDIEEDIVRALEETADDYIIKPVRPRVLLARLTALLRRTAPPKAEQEELIRVGQLEIAPSAFEARLAGELLALTRTEFCILLFLARHPNVAFRRHDIIRAVHGEAFHLGERSVDFQIHGLRQKLGAAAEMIVTVRAVGFKLRAEG